MEGAGVQGFLDRRTIRLAGEPQRATHRRRNELAALPARTRTCAAEGRDGHVDQARIDLLDGGTCQATVLKAREALVIEEERGRGEGGRIGLPAHHLGTQGTEIARQWPGSHSAERQHAVSDKRHQQDSSPR